MESLSERVNNEMNYILFDHQQKARAFVSALSPKYTPIPRTSGVYKSAKFILTDNDVLTRRSRLEELRRAGIGKVFVYPHAGRPSLVSAFYDPYPHTTVKFVATDGHAEVLRRLGDKGKIQAVGWSLCPLREFRPREVIHKVLFAPIHPRNSEVDKKVNQAVFEKLCGLVRTDNIQLTVRYLSPLEGNGIKKYYHPNIIFFEGSAGPDWKQIDESDMVVAHQTFAFISVARGVPTLMMGEDIAPHVEFRNGEYLEARGWNDYKNIIMYPLDILYSDDPLSLMEKAATSDEAICDWRKRMIGEAFDAGAVMNVINGYL